MTELYSVAMKTAVSIPNDIFEAADQLAKRRKVSRSQLYADALRQLLATERSSDITAQLNEVYADHDPSEDAWLDAENRHFFEHVADEWIDS